MQTALHSFDVFDTVLTRSVGDPHAVFLCVGLIAQQRGIPVGTPARFKRLRVQAEAEARQSCGRGDTNLREIYDRLAVLAALTVEQASQLEQMELEAESSGIRPVKLLAGDVFDARTKNGRVAFVSDMYLPSSLIENKLRDYGLFQNGDQLWVSAERGATKESGELFRAILGDTGLPPKHVLHRGDNLSSDVRSPRRLGIRTTPFASARLNRYERILERFSEESGAVTSFFAGASRLVRLEKEADDRRAAVIREVAAGVAGPALLAYVFWILQYARRHDCRRIHFLARDGQILFKLSRLAARVVGYRGELRYFYASRQALRLPATDAFDPSSMQWALEDTDFLSLNSFLARLDLTPEQGVPFFSKLGLDPAGADASLDRHSRVRLSALLRDTGFQRVVAERSAVRKRALCRYLQQEGFFGPDRFCVVDLGWNGTLQAALERVLMDEGVELPAGLYFGLHRRPPTRHAGVAEAFFFDDQRALGQTSRDYWVEPMMEVFCAADHGTTMGYEAGATGAEPRLKVPRNQAALDWGLANQQEAILKFAEFALDRVGADLDPESLRAPVDALLSEFWNHPTSAEAEAFGAFPYSDDQTESSSRELGEPFGVRDVLRSAYRGKTTPPHRAGWSAGGLMRSPAPIRWMLPPAVKLGGWWRR
jgi:FMN phosphatase YigB (HAD superfamily)